MILDSEDQRGVIILALRNVQIQGAAGDPELLRHIQLVHEIIGAVESAEVDGVPNSPAVVSLADR